MRHGLTRGVRYLLNGQIIKRENKKMTTTLENRIGTQYVSIPGQELADLLTGALVASDKGKNSLDRLSGVYLSAKGNTFAVIATDRYKLIKGVTKSIRQVDDTDRGELAESFLPNDTVKAILTAIKGCPVVNIARDGMELTIKGAQVITVSLIDFTAPPTAPIIEKISGEPVDMPSVCLDLNFLATFAKVPTTGKGARFKFHGAKQPVSLEIYHSLIEWTCLIMPMTDIK